MFPLVEAAALPQVCFCFHSASFHFNLALTIVSPLFDLSFFTPILLSSVSVLLIPVPSSLQHANSTV